MYFRQIANLMDRHGEPQKPVNLQPDDDIMDLLKYCEDKLNS